MAQAMYGKGGPGAPGAGPSPDGHGDVGAKGKDDVIDAEFVDVDEGKK